MEQNTKLAQKLVKILASLSAVPKQGYNKHQKYQYMREVDVLEALKSELIKHKIIMLTSSKLVDLKEKEKSYLTTVETSHVFLDSESGEQLTITSVGSGWDSTDKGSAKAITSAVKYAIMKTFMISDEGQDVENDGESVQKPVSTTSKQFNKTFKTTNNKTEEVAVTIPEINPTAEIAVTANNSTPTTIDTTKPISSKKFSFGKRLVASITTPYESPVVKALIKEEYKQLKEDVEFNPEE